MMDLEEAEQLALEADIEMDEASKPHVTLTIPHHYSLRHTHEINGIKIERVHGRSDGLLSGAARRISSLFHS